MQRQALQLALLRAHPDLGTRLKISEVSQKEQAGVGLDRLSKDEYVSLFPLIRGMLSNLIFLLLWQ